MSLLVTGGYGAWSTDYTDHSNTLRQIAPLYHGHRILPSMHSLILYQGYMHTNLFMAAAGHYTI